MPTILSSRDPAAYRGRIAPSPTGLLHLGHARTFFTAHQRAQAAGGTMVMRIEDIDSHRCRPEYVDAALEDLKWLGITWQEGPDVGGAYPPYQQSENLQRYRDSLIALQRSGHVYPCRCSRKDIIRALSAPHEYGDGDEPVYPGTCRPQDSTVPAAGEAPVTWRFRVPDGTTIRFVDQALGPQEFVCGKDFGDFPVWRKDDLPSYQLAVTVDDGQMQISEVVRGSDLLISTARQILLYQALGLEPPAFYHCPLVLDHLGDRLAKRHASLSLQELRQHGKTPAEVRAMWQTMDLA